jgi:type I restriction enzyme, S subunit
MLDDLTELPEGWEWTTIEEIAGYIQRGKSPKYTEWSELPVVNQKAVRWYGVEEEHLKYIHPDQWSQWSDERFLQSGDILWNSTGTGTIGRAAIYTELLNFKRAVADSHVTVVRATNYNSSLLHFWIMSPVVQSKIEGMQSGSTNQVELSRVEVLKTKVPLPPLNEQKRIVAKIEELRSHTQAARNAIAHIPKLLEQFRQSVLAAAFRGDLTAEWRSENPDVEPAEVLLERHKLIKSRKWKKVEAERIDLSLIKLNSTELPKIENSWAYTIIPLLLSGDRVGLKTGPFGSMLKKEDHLTAGIPVLGIENIGKNEFKRGNKVFISQSKARELSEYEVRTGDIIISRSGTVGEICIVPNDIGEARISTNLIRVCTDDLIILPEFFCFLFNGCDFVLNQISKLCSGSTRDFLNQSILNSIIFPIPPRVEQKEIINRIQELFEKIDRIEEQYQFIKTELDRLDRSILAKAFKGELVPQDPTDEPAIVLLERIRNDRASQVKPAKTKRKKA